MERLPRGRHGLPREFVAQNQRERLLASLAECLQEGGYDGTTVSTIGKRAGVSKSVLAGKTTQLGDFLPDVAGFVLSPHLGTAEARRIISAR